MYKFWTRRDLYIYLECVFNTSWKYGFVLLIYKIYNISIILLEIPTTYMWDDIKVPFFNSKLRFNRCLYGMWDGLSLKRHVKTRITVYLGVLKTVYYIITLYVSLVLYTYVYLQTIDIPCILIWIFYHTNSIRFISCIN